MRSDLALKALRAAYDRLGVTGCTYQPASGPVVEDLTLMLVEPDVTTGFEGEVLTAQIEARCLAADLTPDLGGVFAIAGQSYKVIASPAFRDRLRLEWACVVDEV